MADHALRRRLVASRHGTVSLGGTDMQALLGRTVVAAMLLSMAVNPAAAQERVIAVTDPGPDVETVGTGERRIAPDRATVNLLIESKASEASAAAAANARAAQAVRDTLRRLGLDSAATTASYTVGTDYEPPRPTRDEGPRRVGYVARTLIRVQLSRIDQVGRVIDGLDPRRPNVMLRETAGGYSTQVTPTEIVVTAGVETKWRFIPGR